MKLLDGASHEITKDFLTISDEKEVLALAGIMGCANSEVDETTQEIFLESACFEPASIRGNARKLGFQSEASLRFERGVDFNIQIQALKKVTNLIIKYLSGSYSVISTVEQKKHIPDQRKITLNLSNLRTKLGYEIKSNKIKKVLKSLDLKVESLKNNFKTEIIPLIGSIQDKRRIEEIIRLWKPATIYHAAAYKHVPIVEHNLIEGLKNNVFGTLKLSQIALQNNVSDFVFISM